ncbi:MAG: hypothetical protein JNN20_02890, partial [Betaproteobacteria bacterium]|nr:hypothetical protein [Betaproteobacteria bacterium]
MNIKPLRIASAPSLKFIAAGFIALGLLSACSKGGDAAKTAPPPIGVAVVKIAPQQVPILVDVVGRTEGS